jgi:hypothetical protein
MESAARPNPFMFPMSPMLRIGDQPIEIAELDPLVRMSYGRSVAQVRFILRPIERNHMSEQQQAQQAPPSPEITVDESATSPTYSNFCRVTATPEELILDFGLNPQPFATGRHEVKATQRIVMNIFTAKRLLMALSMTVQRQEEAFGAIELDVNRRVSRRQTLPPFPPAEPTSPPEVITLDR